MKVLAYCHMYKCENGRFTFTLTKDEIKTFKKIIKQRNDTAQNFSKCEIHFNRNHTCPTCNHFTEDLVFKYPKIAWITNNKNIQINWLLT